jgi:hypothetical protein
MKLSARDRRAIIWGGAVLAGLLVVRFALLPVLDGWQAARARGAAAWAQLSALERNARRALGQRRRLTRAYGHSVPDPLPDVERARMDLLAAHELLKGQGFEPTEYQRQPARAPRRSDGRAALPADVTLVSLLIRGSCDPQQLSHCFAALREADTLVFVDRVTAVKSEKDAGKLEVDLVLATVARKEAAP